MEEKEIVSLLSSWLDSDQVEGAVLLVTQPNFSEEKFLESLSMRALCNTVSGDIACGTCPPCKQVQSKNHPDIVVLSSDEEVYKMEHVQGVIHALHTIPLSGKRLVIIPSAERLMMEGANAFLKTLEEPSAHTRILLTSAYVRRLLPTIRSRCRIMSMPAGERSAGAEVTPARPIIDEMIGRKSKQAFSDEELVKVEEMLGSLIRQNGSTNSVYRAMLRLRDCYKIRSMRGGNDKMASDVLLASLIQLRETVK